MRVRLRHVDVNAQGVGLGEQEQRAPGAAAGVNQVARINAAARDHAGKGRRNALEALELAQALDVGVGRREVGLGLRFTAAPLVELLLRHGIAFAQRLPAFHAAFGQRKALCRLLARRDALRQLLVHLRGVDLGQQLALGDAAADVLVPALEIAAGARRNGRLHIALQRTGQHQALRGAARTRLGDLDVLLGAFGRAFFQGLCIGDAAEHRAAGSGGEQEHQHEHCHLRAPDDVAALDKFFPGGRIDHVYAQFVVTLFRHCLSSPAG